MTEAENKIRNTRAQVAYVKVPFDAVGDDAVEVTDADLKSYINDHKELYTNDVETRVIEYITFPIIATSEDTMKIYEDILSRTSALKTAVNDSIYAINNNGAKPTLYYSKDLLPEALVDAIDTLSVGNTYGPYLDNGVYSSVKLVDRKVIPDSVEARLIFRQAPSTSPALVESAKDYIDSLRTLLRTGAQEFDSLAINNSQDGTAAQGGDLGYMTQGQLNPVLDEILFLNGNKKGDLLEAEMENGVFLIEIIDVIQNSNDPKFRLAYINASIVPSEETQNNVLDNVNDFISENRTLESMKSAAAEQNLNIRTSAPLDRNAYSIGALGSEQSSRNIVRWAFDPSTEKGDVSPDFFSYQNPVLYYTDKYVIAGLSDVVPAGVQKAENLRNELTPIVRNMKKGEAIIKEIQGKDLNAVASQYSVSIDTIASVTMNTTLIPALGNEPKFVSAVFSVNENEIGGPVIGNSGVYLVKPIAVAGPGGTTNVASVRSSATSQARSRVSQNLLESLKKKAKIKDERYEYGF
jgi:peptidyl-prolyl cis-trans isomerase D